MYEDAFDLSMAPTRPGDPGKLLSTKYYEYSGDGNVTRIITEHPVIGGAQMAMSAGGGEIYTGKAAKSGTVTVFEQRGDKMSPRPPKSKWVTVPVSRAVSRGFSVSQAVGIGSGNWSDALERASRRLREG